MTEIIDPFDVNTVAVENHGNQTVFRYAQDISGICNNNEAERKAGIHDGKSEFRKVASIPMVVWNMWEQMGITGNKRELRKAIERHKDSLKTTDKRLI